MSTRAGGYRGGGAPDAQGVRVAAYERTRVERRRLPRFLLLLCSCNRHGFEGGHKSSVLLR